MHIMATTEKVTFNALKKSYKNILSMRFFAFQYKNVKKVHDSFFL